MMLGGFTRVSLYRVYRGEVMSSLPVAVVYSVTEPGVSDSVDYASEAMAFRVRTLVSTAPSEGRGAS